MTMNIFEHTQFYFFAVLGTFMVWTFAAAWIGLRSHRRVQELEREIAHERAEREKLAQRLQSFEHNPFPWRGHAAN